MAEPPRGGQGTNECNANLGIDVHQETIVEAVAGAGGEETVYQGPIRTERATWWRPVGQLTAVWVSDA